MKQRFVRIRILDLKDYKNLQWVVVSERYLDRISAVPQFFNHQGLNS